MNTRELGRWRKLWTRPSATWELLPLSARGLGDELIRYCDEQGRVSMPPNMQPHEVCARLLRAHHSEMRRVKADLAALIADGFVVVEAGALVVRNFVEAQASVTESGHRMREKQERDASRVGASVPRADGSVPRVGAELPRAEQSAKPAESLEPVRQADASEKREEEKREESQSAREETPPAQPDRRPLADAALAAFFGSTVVDHRAVPSVALDFADACRALDVAPGELRVLNDYLTANRAAWAWTGMHKLNLSWFLSGKGGKGANLTEQMAGARAWHEARSATEKRDADQAAASRAAVEAMNRPTGLTQEQQLAQVQKVRADYAAYRAAQKARVANGSAA
ncbi:MAG: hypothetical protein RIS45_1258 [Planctomycetota bacterium]